MSGQACEPVELRFCEPVKLVEQLRKLKALGTPLSRYDDASRWMIGLMTRGFTHAPTCNNTDQHGLCLGHPVGEGGAS